ncbi:MAG: hypothetical protein HC800_07630 [Phormidesmis sp. RL_2_1]|nr:hypothetical protein [Phormidesmis sp. RL_2_1]
MINNSQPAIPATLALADIAQRLAQAGIAIADRTLAEQILAWTEGHPILTEQLLEDVIQAVAQRHSPVATMMTAGDGPFANGLASELANDLVNKLVKARFTPDMLAPDVLFADPSSWQSQRVSELLADIQQALVADQSQGCRLLKYYQLVLLARHHLPTGYLSEQQRLIELGLVRQDAQGNIKVANPIYRRIFSPTWVDEQLNQPFVLQKGRWILLTSLFSILTFILLQSVFRYFPWAPTHRCVQSAELRDATLASVSLAPESMEQAIDQLLTLKRQNQLSEPCQAVLYDLQYSYGIYVAASAHNNPLQAATYLCQIPESYYRERNVVPWFSRWSNLYESVDFADHLDRYVERQPCPGYDFLNRASSSTSYWPKPVRLSRAFYP